MRADVGPDEAEAAEPDSALRRLSRRGAPTADPHHEGARVLESGRLAAAGVARTHTLTRNAVGGDAAAGRSINVRGTPLVSSPAAPGRQRFWRCSSTFRSASLRMPRASPALRSLCSDTTRTSGAAQANVARRSRGQRKLPAEHAGRGSALPREAFDVWFSAGCVRAGT